MHSNRTRGLRRQEKQRQELEKQRLERERKEAASRKKQGTVSQSSQPTPSTSGLTPPNLLSLTSPSSSFATGTKVYKCPKCTLMFLESASLQAHMTQCHSGDQHKTSQPIADDPLSSTAIPKQAMSRPSYQPPYQPQGPQITGRLQSYTGNAARSGHNQMQQMDQLPQHITLQEMRIPQLRRKFEERPIWEGVMEIPVIGGIKQIKCSMAVPKNSVLHMSPRLWPPKMTMKVYPDHNNIILDHLGVDVIYFGCSSPSEGSILRNLLSGGDNIGIVQPVGAVPQCPLKAFILKPGVYFSATIPRDQNELVRRLHQVAPGWDQRQLDVSMEQSQFSLEGGRAPSSNTVPVSSNETIPPGFEYDPNMPMNFDYQLLAYKNKLEQDRIGQAFLRMPNPFDQNFGTVTTGKTQPEPPTSESEEKSGELNQEDAQKLLYEAMKKGYVTSQHVVIILVGIAGSGKSSFKRVVLDLPPEETRVSTALAEAAIRNISISRAILSDSDSVTWEVVTSEELLAMIADAIKEVGEPQEPTKAPSTSATSLSSNGNLASTSLRDDESESRDPKTPDTLESSNHGSPKAIGGATSTITAQDRDEALEFKDDPLLPLIRKSKGSRRLLGVHWVYIIDTGGQPQFLQLLPAFIKSISSCVCLLRLDQSLDEKPLVKYFDKLGKQCGESYPSEHTNLQIIESCVRTIHSRCCLNSDKPPNCFVVGTHLDECEKKAHLETLEEKNERLLKKLSSPLMEQSLTFYRSGDETEKLIFPLNCKNPEKRDKNVAAEFRKCVMSRCSEPECKIPLAWFVLEERIRQYAVKHNVAYVERATCYKIASQLHMSSKIFEAALDHLLKLNIFRCYSSLPNLIFCDTQVVLLKLTELVQYSFQLRRSIIYGISGEDISFKNEGIISVKFLKAARFSSFYSDLFTPECFLKILRELLAVADMQGGKHFLPCLLKELNEKEICKHRTSSKSLSALLIYLDGCLPNGLFTSLVASLKNSHGWMLASKGHKPSCLYQNCVKFRIPGNLPGTLTLIASFKYIEIHIDRCIELEIDGVCTRVLEDVRRGLEASWKVLYPGEISFKLAFFCSSCLSTPSSDFSPDRPAEVQNHYAVISECRKYELCSSDQSRGLELCESKLRWLRNTKYHCDASQVALSQSYATTQSLGAVEAVAQQFNASRSEFQRCLSFLPVAAFPYLDKMLDWDSDRDVDLIEVAKQLVNWEELLVVPFGLTPTDIHDIQYVHPRQPELQRREALRRWKSKYGVHATYKQLLETFVEAKHMEGVKAVCELLIKKASTASLGKHPSMSHEEDLPPKSKQTDIM